MTDLSKEELYEIVKIPPLGIQIGYSLFEYLNELGFDLFIQRVKDIRLKIAEEKGVILSPISIRDNLELLPGEYSILLRGKKIAGAILSIKNLLAIDINNTGHKLDGVETLDPTFLLPAFWINPAIRKEVEESNFLVVEIENILITHLTETIHRNLYELQGRQETQFLIEQLAKTHSKVIEEVTPSYLSIGDITKILKNLLNENISILDFLTIMETLGDHVRETKDLNLLTSYIKDKIR